MRLFKKDKSFTLSEKSFEKTYQSFRVEGSGKDADAFFEKNKDNLMNLIESKLHDLGSAKIQITTWIEWIKEEDEDDNVIVEKAFNSKIIEVFQGSDLKELTDEMFAQNSN